LSPAQDADVKQRARRLIALCDDAAEGDDATVALSCMLDLWGTG
jgi:hypothetical protein